MRLKEGHGVGAFGGANRAELGESFGGLFGEVTDEAKAAVEFDGEEVLSPVEVDAGNPKPSAGELADQVEDLRRDGNAAMTTSEVSEEVGLAIGLEEVAVSMLGEV